MPWYVADRFCSTSTLSYKVRAVLQVPVIIENHVELTDHAVVEAFDGDTVHVRGPKVINGEERITRTPLAGLL